MDSGFIAQESLETVKKYDADWFGLVNDENQDYLQMTYGKLIPVFVKAIQELTAKNKDLEEKIDQLRSQI